MSNPRLLIAALAVAAASFPLVAQTIPLGEDTTTVQLSPFQVSTDKDVGYVAANSLSGSRLNTELRNTPAAISVFTKEFLEDIGVLGTMQAMQYALNASREYTDYTGLAAVQQDDGLIQVRGFAGASLARDLFSWRVSSDVFNTERLDFSRGPNSILFGIGGPGGIVNTTTKRAHLAGKSTDQVQLRIGSWDDYRASVDLNRRVGKNFAVRANLLWQDRKGWREFEFLKSKTGALAATYRPFLHTEIRVQGEYGDRKQLVAMPWPSPDYSGNWIAAGRPIAADNTEPVAGTGTNASRSLVYDPLSGTGLVAWFGTRQTLRAPGSPTLAGNARSLLDFSLIPRDSYLGGPGSTSNNRYGTYAAFIEQKIGGLVLELAFNRQWNFRRADFGVTWNNMGALGEANALLPANALPDGSLPAGAGQRNPNVGRLYVQSQALYRDIDNDTKTWRLTAAYEIDRQRQRFGRHQFAFLASSETYDVFEEALDEVNTTPAGSALYPLDISAASNAIWRRTYLDFSSSDPNKRGGLAPRQYPIRMNGVTSGFRRARNTSNVQTTTTDSVMLAGQSRLWGEKLTATWGLRRDMQDFWNGGNATRDPITREFSIQQARQTNTDFSGNTRTYGVVVRPLPWLGLVYNNASNFVPQTFIDINNQPMGIREGTGSDIGVKLTLFSGKINLGISRYRLTESNRVALDASTTTSLVPAINEIWEALGQVEKMIPSQNSRDSVDNAGKGWEVELTANPSRNIRFAFNASEAEVVQSRTLPRMGAYMASNLALWQQNSTRPLVAPFTAIDTSVNPTVADAIRSANTWLGVIRRAEGKAPRQAVKYRVNAFGSYTLRRSGEWYNELSVGGGVNYRSKPVTGYDSTRNFTEVYGGEVVLFNAMLAKNWVTRFGPLRTQLNVDNLFNNDDLVITDKDNTGTFRFLFMEPRRWSVTVTKSF